MGNKITILITGEQGDVGSNIYQLYKNNGFEIYPYIDKNTDINADRILHLAAFSPPESPDVIIKSNINFLQEIVEYSLKHKINEFIFFSSVSLYGMQNKEDLSEDDPINKPDIYGCSKLIGEIYLENSTLKVLCLRFPAILGIRNTTNLLSRFYMKLNNNENVEITNPNKLFNNFINVENLFGFLTKVKITKKFDVINMSGNKELTLLEIVKYMRKELNSKSKIIISKRKSNFFNISNEKAKTQYGFTPYSTKDSIKKWIQQRQIYEKNKVS